MNVLDKIYSLLPNGMQNLMIYLYNKKAYKSRYGGNYRIYRDKIYENRILTLEELKIYQKKRYKELINFTVKNSVFYSEIFKEIENVNELNNISSLPIITKETLRNNINSIIVDDGDNSLKSKTGGTTGKSLEVRNYPRNAQERFAFLDDFRSRFGYELGKRTAWFSGKKLLGNNDIRINRFWKTDTIHHVRYYSTFHVKDEYLKYYIENLIAYKPEYLVGFPSTMVEIAKYGLAKGYDFPDNVVKAIFPTAETITSDTRYHIEKFFKTRLYNQYASSEGAPFIFECKEGKLHLELQSGVFEVLDENNNSTISGRLVVTSFTNEGTPLIRYDIGDSIELYDENITCNCGNHNPMVKEILGRIDDYIYSPQNGKINLGNVSNTLKDTKGIVRFQVLQEELNSIKILMVIDKALYSKNIEAKFIHNWRDRVGDKMQLSLEYVDEIHVEKSGKYRIVKNSIKHLL